MSKQFATGTREWAVHTVKQRLRLLLGSGECPPVQADQVARPVASDAAQALVRNRHVSEHACAAPGAGSLTCPEFAKTAMISVPVYPRARKRIYRPLSEWREMRARGELA